MNAAAPSTRIVVLGGGVGGLATVRHLERVFKHSPATEIVLVSRDNFFLLSPLLFEACSGVLDVRHCVQPIRPCLRRARFIKATVEGVAHWLVAQGRVAEAEREVQTLLQREPPYPKKVVLTDPHKEASRQGGAPKLGFASLFSQQYLRSTILAAVPWFLQDLGTYGIGIFTPIILAAAIGAKNDHARSLAEIIHNHILGARGAAMIDALLIVGIVCAVLLVDRVGRIRLQAYGFIGCAVGLFLASLSSHYGGSAKMVFIVSGFMLFNFMTNIGPNAMTYLIAGEVFPTRIRGMGAGFAASFAKIGAATTAFLFPILLKDLGIQTLLYILIATSVLGAVITWRFGIEMKGVNLESLGQAVPGAPSREPASGFKIAKA